MDSSHPSQVEVLSDNDSSSDDNSTPSSESSAYSSNIERSLASIEEFGPESSRPIPNEDESTIKKLAWMSMSTSDEEFDRESSLSILHEDINEDTNEDINEVIKKLAWVPTFKEKLGESISRLLNKPMTFCTSGKMNASPIISISLVKVEKCISFPLHEDMLDSIIPSLEQSAFGRGTETIVDTSVRNSWELSHMDFEIVNSEWNSYLMDVLIPLIQHDLRLEVGFRLSLYKFLLYKTGSFFKPHRDSEKEDGMFGTLVIQLPSLYDGGKLIVRHNHRTEEVDLCSGTSPQNGYSTFYTAFYCDCEHEILPVTKGVRACLVYNLVMIGEIEKTIPVAAQVEVEVEGREADLVDLLRNYWPNNQKVVYCLSHKYSQKNLSLENLKSTDRAIAQFFQKYADSCSLEVMIGILKRKVIDWSCSDDYCSGSDGFYGYCHDYYDDRYDDCDYYNDYSNKFKLRHIKPLDKSRHNRLPSMKVDLRSDVLPENSFQDIKAFDRKKRDTGNEGVQMCLFYQCAAIMIFRHDDLVPILIRDDLKISNVPELFFREFEKSKQNFSDENEKRKILGWARVMMDRWSNIGRYDTGYSLLTGSKMFETLLLLDNIELLKRYLQYLNSEDGNFLSYLYKMCHRHGWAAFASDIISKFDTIGYNRMARVQMFIDYQDEVTQNDADKQSIIERILENEYEE